MKRPDAVFEVRVSKAYRVFGCKEKTDQEKRGLFGFHSFSTCPNCRIEFAGYEFWGSNGHCQGSGFNLEQMKHWIRMNARKQWPMREPGNPSNIIGTMGYRFKVGSDIHYKG